MYQYDTFDRQLVQERVADFREQTARYFAGELGEEEFKPLRLMNGLYIQRFAPMLRVAIPSDRATNAAMPPCSRWCRCIRARGECPVLRLSHWEDSESHAVQIRPGRPTDAD